jgi:Tfp pilus assembly protein PilO
MIDTVSVQKDRVAAVPAGPAKSSSVARRSSALLPARALANRLTSEWLPTIAWGASRTGRSGLAGLALLLASALFFFSTHLQMTDQVAGLRTELATATTRAATAPVVAADPATALRSLPSREQMPALLGTLLKLADAQSLKIDTGKYDMSATKTGGVVRYKVSFPITGPYPQVRKFIDSTLVAMPAVAISELSFERKAIGEAAVEAQIRLTVFTRSAP